MEVLQTLLGSKSGQGTVCWIGTAAAPRAPVTSQQTVSVVDGGIAGDHHCRPGRKRQVTILQQEHLQAVAALLNSDPPDPGQLRRNVVVAGISVSSLRHCRFRIGTAVLEGSGSCPPCSRMEENLGPGGYAAMLGHGGITATVHTSGTISCGDLVEVLEVLPQRVADTK